MKAKILDFDYRTNRVVLEFDADFSEVFDKFNGKDVNVDFKLWRLRRSGAANRYMWVLIDKIAKVQHLTKNEVYRNEIKEIGGTSEVVIVANRAVEKFCKSWEQQGLGWQTEIAFSDDENTDVIVYYGSSVFDREQMTQIIENLIFEAENMGIDTETPDKKLWWESLEAEYEKG